jgi:lantibiotic modifying enzyme
MASRNASPRATSPTAPGTAGWRPLLVGDSRQRALALVDQVVEQTAPGTLEGADVSLHHGSSGFALLHAYAAQRSGISTALDWLRDAITRIRECGPDNSLSAGLSGVGFTLHHVSQLLSIAAPDRDAAIDELIGNRLIRHARWPGHIDLLYGLAGIAVFALERADAIGDERNLELVVDRFAELATRAPDGVTWLTGPSLLVDRQREEAPNGYFNLGVAHGVPAIVAVLAAAAARGVDRAESLAREGLTWILTQIGDGDVPVWVTPNHDAKPGRQVGWCYGSPGISAALLFASRALGDEAAEQAAIALACRAAAQREDGSNVTDPWICHGAAGVAHGFNRLYQATGRAELAKAARYWFDRTLDMELVDDDHGLLNGSTGLALCLLAATSDIDPEWDRAFAMSPLVSW